ncbi:MFS transporter [Helicobacter aurati]|uniref:MFS transporter n=1 Tax=Helicobacter aurati TaxID=137778 RepID=A0A3D8J9B9_9HELI|nr:MFS transporter [Helicobacter aurati]RDU73775.1 MFS transporter [Helicobacter aurati]
MFLKNFLYRIFHIRDDELKLLLFAFLFMFLLFTSYSLLRPLRDSMGIAGGTRDLKWLFGATFIVTLLGSVIAMWISSMCKRKNYINAVFGFFISNLLIFYACFSFFPHDSNEFTWLARIFFVWTSLFVMFVLSTAWSLMSDIFNKEQSHRLFGIIAAGVSLGGIIGSSIVSLLVKKAGIDSLILCSALLLFIAALIKNILLYQIRNSDTFSARFDEPLNAKNPFIGFKILLSSKYLLLFGLFIILLSSTTTFLYLEQARLVELHFSTKEERTAAFANITLIVQTLSLIGQLFLTGSIAKSLGIRFLLCVIPFLLGIGFIVLCFTHPAFLPFVIILTLRNVGEYALIKPAREMLFVPLDGDSKYKVKNFLDTVVYRAGDALSAQLEGLLANQSIQVALLSGAICACSWGICGWILGEKYQHKQFK